MRRESAVSYNYRDQEPALADNACQSAKARGPTATSLHLFSTRTEASAEHVECDDFTDNHTGFGNKSVGC